MPIIPKPKSQTKGGVESSKRESRVKMETSDAKYMVGNEVKTIKFLDMRGNIATSARNSLNISPGVFAVNPFLGETLAEDTFNILDYAGLGNVDACASHLSRSQELREQVTEKTLREVPISDSYVLKVVSNLQATTVQNVVSFNKACAVMSFNILRHTTDEMYDWTKNEYVSLGLKEKAAKVNPNIINRLAGQINLSPQSPYYYLVTPGYEFLYDAYPAETIAMTLVKMAYRKTMNLPDSMKDSDICSSLNAKINKRHNLAVNNIDDIIKQIGKKHIEDMYNTLTQNIAMSGKESRNVETAQSFLALIESFKTTT
uniref:Putative coat protein n=1 Tax=European mountain ash ringspot-associated virus (isolate Sorbus aucuparia) TaxID=1980426 RepID=E0Y3V2_EMARV|nr:putative coat protein [European mountain ash ringspot-associated virus]